MKFKHYVLLFLLTMVGSLFTGCAKDRDKNASEAKDSMEQADKELQAARAEYESEWRQFKNDAEAKISSNEKSIDEYKAEIKLASKKFKVKYEKELVLLEQKNIALRKKIADYKYDGKSNWEVFKHDVKHDLEVVGNTLNDIFDKKDLKTDCLLLTE